jgi:gliding motility-associated-like protein
MLSKAGVYVDTVPSITTGCDSIITLTLSVIYPVTYSYDHSICKDQSYDFNGKMLNKTGVYVDTILSITTGCDSIITHTLSVIDPVTYSYDHSICKDQSYDFNGKMLSKAGVYVDTVPSIATSCDSIVTLTLDVIDPVLFSYNKQICTGNSYLFGNQTLTTSGIYTDTVSSIATGCDSIVTLNLSVQPYLTGSYSHHICQGDGYWFGGKYLTQTDIYHDTLHTLVVGCDSIATLYLTVDTLIRQSVDRQICAGEEYLFGDQMLTAQGTYRDTLKSVAGCDSIIATLRLTVAYPSDVVYLNETISKGENYILNGHVYNQSGIYVDTLTNYAGCDSVIVLYLEVFECPEIEIPIFFTPNSDNYNDKWEIRNIDCYEHVVEIYDRFGKLLRRWENNFTGWDGTYLGNRMPSTDYWYMVTLGKGEPRMGHFTLIR